MAEDFVIEMLHITKEFPGIKANDDITLQLRKGEVHALLGENGAGKSTLMSVLFGLYQPEEGKILKNGKEVAIRNPNDANALGIGMVHQHFKLVECFSVLDNIILGVEPNKLGFLQKAEARKKVMALSEKYGLRDCLFYALIGKGKLPFCFINHKYAVKVGFGFYQAGLYGIAQPVLGGLVNHLEWRQGFHSRQRSPGGAGGGKA